MDKEFLDWVYLSVTGQLVEGFQCREVENLYADGAPCRQLYGEMISAYWRWCERQGTEEDPDGEIMINSLLRICEITACKMFEYGAAYGAGKWKKGG